MSLDAANPRINATLTASAGSGKTWMLVTRILRLLLDGAEPGGIMALTFTRKAAAEMQQRLAERLYQLATVDDAGLDISLGELGLDDSDAYRARARQLYEYHQYCDFPVRTQTFHSFCQDILARFPLEAKVPPGFDLLESSSLLIRQARDALFNEAALDMHGEVAGQLEALMQACGGPFQLERALHSFLDHRSDWWAYTEHAESPCAWATQQLRERLEVTPGEDPVEDFFSESGMQDLRTFARLLAATGGKTNARHADTLAMVLAEDAHDERSFAAVTGCFLTQKNTPIISGRKDSKSLRKSLGQDADNFLELAQTLPERILATREHINRLNTFQLNRLWYLCGEYFVNHYQKLKREQRVLDFTDLEWSSYRLLQHSDNALWVQYKLDQRIDHLLIDEFQDTNPTQWQLILPLLEEMASGETERPRSVFLVGDEKQSIYSFRRAKPELQAQASGWLAEHLDARAFPLNWSRRSSPAIINTVNAVFGQPEYQALLPGFREHGTHCEHTPGRVEVFPLFRSEKQDTEQDDTPVLRNPLHEPRAEKPGIHQQEGRLIADTIRQLIDDRITIGEGDAARAIRYDDIYILVRKRSHLPDYEQALRQAGIPYLGANRGTLLDCIEIQDMEALLDTLLTPFNNLALAQVLKSPLFGASDDDLMTIALHGGSHLWFDRIQALAMQLATDHPIHRAATSINRWRAQVDRVPVHDLLDRIYDEADILACYLAATPDSLRPRVHANLTRFLELALELDSGRYPSLMHFLQYIRSLRTLASDAPDEAPMEAAESRVKIMTIHASKGLEAPVVFLADSVTSSKDTSTLSTLVDWPANRQNPGHFQLIPGKDCRDGMSEQLLAEQQRVQQREDAHLLYVAVTRAKQLLYVSGCLPEKRPFLDWHTPMLEALRQINDDPEADNPVYCFGELPGFQGPETDDETNAPSAIDIELPKTIAPPTPRDRLLAPSHTVEGHGGFTEDEDAQTRGLAIHRCLELLTAQQDFSTDHVRQVLVEELGLSPGDPLLQECIDETRQLVSQPALETVFRPADDVRVYNECPLHYRHRGQMVYGIIDRLLISDREAFIIDYKSHTRARPGNLEELARPYFEQMQLYAHGVASAWPGKTVKAALLFTHCGCLHPLDVA